MSAQAKYLTGDREGIKKFIDKFDVSQSDLDLFAYVHFITK